MHASLLIEMIKDIVIKNEIDKFLDTLEENVSDDTDLFWLIPEIIRVLCQTRATYMSDNEVYFLKLIEFLDNLKEPYQTVRSILLNVPLTYISFLISAKDSGRFRAEWHMYNFINNLFGGLGKKIKVNVLFFDRDLKHLKNGEIKHIKYDTLEDGLRDFYLSLKNNYDYIILQEPGVAQIYYPVNIKNIIHILEENNIKYYPLTETTEGGWVTIQGNKLHIMVENIWFDIDIPIPILQGDTVTLQGLLLKSQEIKNDASF